MATKEAITANPKAIKEAISTWESFIKVMTIAAVLAGIILSLMAITLV
mgnify:CR=1 FL=1